jgi:hypothetical protein
MNEPHTVESDAGFRTKPNPDQPERCPSIDPHDTLQCGRRIHDDEQCQFGGIAWKKGTQRYMSDRERADRLEAMCERLAERLAELPDLWRTEGRAVMFNRAGDDLAPQARVGKWLNEKTSVTPHTE